MKYDRSENPRNTCSVCGALGVNRRTCPGLSGDFWEAAINSNREPGSINLRLEHEALARPKQERESQMTNITCTYGLPLSQYPIEGWGDLQVDSGTEEVDETRADWELVVVDTMKQDIRDIRDMIEALAIHLGAMN